MKKAVSILMAVCIILSVFATGAFASSEEPATKTECNGECDYTPTIVVHGIGQSNLWLLDDNGEYVLDDDGDKIDCFPCYADVMPIVKDALFPLLASLFTQHDVGLSKALSKVVDTIFYMHEADSNGQESKYVGLEEYPYSVAECSEYEKEQIYDFVPMSSLGEEYEDHLYYFAYNSFGNNINTVDRLYKYIEMVKEETGHDKVNIVPISLGGTVANGLLEYYSGRYEGRPCVYDSIHKMIYIVPAADGSSLVGDVYTKDITFLDADYLYNGFLELLMDESEARWIEIALRIVPDEVIMNVLDNTVDALIEKVLAKCTNMWALVPKDDYPEAAAMWLQGDEMAEIKKQTDMYYSAQLNSKSNILTLRDEYGAEIFDIVDYDALMYNIGNSYDKENSDGIIDVDSTSFGAHLANYGETLPESYTQQCTNCTNPEHNHISPDRVVDASTGLLPETTFYFDDQNHEDTADNDVIMKLACNLIKYDDIHDIYSDPAYPQFNGGRDIKDIRNRLNDLKNARAQVTDGENAVALDELIEKGEALMEKTVSETGEGKAFVAEAEELLIKLGFREAEEVKDPAFPKKISLWLYEHFGTNGFSEYPVTAVKNLFGKIFG